MVVWEDADLIAFAVVASGVLFEKVAVWREETEKAQKAQEQKTNQDSAGSPYIPTEHHV